MEWGLVPIFPAGKTSRRTLAAFLLPAWLQMQSSPTESMESMKHRLKELEKVLED
jgi:hypothetical protein